MCGIVGYVGRQQAEPILVDGLARLEYRGYDSAGVATFDGGADRACAAPTASSPASRRALRDRPLGGRIGIGHTRWATHGRPSERNAHPHTAGRRRRVVHNGIIENYRELRDELEAGGHAFASRDRHRGHRPPDRRRALTTGSDLLDGRARGAAPASTAPTPSASSRRPTRTPSWSPSSRQPARRRPRRRARTSSPPTCPRSSRTRARCSSSRTARSPCSRDDGVQVLDRRRTRRSTASRATIQWTRCSAEKGGYKHFMLKEIFEQPRAITDTLRGRAARGDGEVYARRLDLSRDELDGSAA